MNERIFELAGQADLYARSDNSSMLFENYQKRYTEKFAELIVKECSAYVEGTGNWLVAMEMKQHLGVEE